jgi:hypothetical protein
MQKSHEKPPLYVLPLVHASTESITAFTYPLTSDENNISPLMSRVMRGNLKFLTDLMESTKLRKPYDGCKIYMDGMHTRTKIPKLHKVSAENPNQFRNQPTMAFLALLSEGGGTFVPTEDKSLLEQSAQAMLTPTLGFADMMEINRLTAKRDKYIAQRIGNTLSRKDRLGLLLIGLAHTSIFKHLEEIDFDPVVPSQALSFLLPPDHHRDSYVRVWQEHCREVTL